MSIKNYIANCRVTLPGRILFHCMTRRRKIALENANRVFKNTLTEDEKLRLIKSFFSHLVQSIKESILIHRRKNNPLPRLEVRGLNYLQEAIDLGRGVLILSAHLGNWEVILPAFIKQTKLLSQKTYVIRKTQRPFLQNKLIALYETSGIKILESKGALLAGHSILRKKNILFFVFDQHFSIQDKSGIAAEFFGEKAGCATGLAYLAKLTGAAVIPVNQFRSQSNIHTVEFYPQIPWIPSEKKEESIYLNTLQYNQTLERFILEHPEQWFGWIHRRWKLNLPSSSTTSMKPNLLNHSFETKNAENTIEY